MKLKNGGLFRRGCFKRASGGPVFSALPEKTGEKRGAGYVWCILRVQFRRVLIFGCYEHTYSPYGRYGTRRLLRYGQICESLPLNGCGKSALRLDLAKQYEFAESLVVWMVTPPDRSAQKSGCLRQLRRPACLPSCGSSSQPPAHPRRGRTSAGSSCCGLQTCTR